MITEIMVMLAMGIINDILVTLYYLFVGRLQALPASLMTILITLLNFFIIEKIIVPINWILILAYAFGCSIGCFSIILYQKDRLRKKMRREVKRKKD